MNWRLVKRTLAPWAIGTVAVVATVEDLFEHFMEGWRKAAARHRPPPAPAVLDRPPPRPFPTDAKPALLALDVHEAYVVLDALNTFATRQQIAGGDEVAAKTADEVTPRLRELIELLNSGAHQQLKAFGIGQAKGRPQG